MPIKRCIYVVVLNFNAFPVIAFPATINYLSVTGCFNRGAGRGCIVYPQVGAVGFEDGVKTPFGESGADAAVSQG